MTQYLLLISGDSSFLLQKISEHLVELIDTLLFELFDSLFCQGYSAFLNGAVKQRRQDLSSEFGRGNARTIGAYVVNGDVRQNEYLIEALIAGTEVHMEFGSCDDDFRDDEFL